MSVSWNNLVQHKLNSLIIVEKNISICACLQHFYSYIPVQGTQFSACVNLQNKKLDCNEYNFQS